MSSIGPQQLHTTLGAIRYISRCRECGWLGELAHNGARWLCPTCINPTQRAQPSRAVRWIVCIDCNQHVLTRNPYKLRCNPCAEQAWADATQSEKGDN